MCCKIYEGERWRMNTFKRAIKSIIRKPVKMLILLVMVVILGSVMAGAITIRNAIDNTVVNLRRNLPPLVVVEPDFDYIYEWITNPDGSGWLEVKDVDPERINITTEHLYALAELPYVYELYISSRTVFQNTDLVQQTFSAGGMVWGGADWEYTAYGSSTPNILYFREGVLEIVSGRLPTTEELRGEKDITPIVVPFTVAQLNELHVGSTLDMYQIIGGCLPQGNYCTIGFESFTEEYAFVRKAYEFEIVGIFDWVHRETPSQNAEADLSLQRTLLQTMFIPTHMVEEMAQFRGEQQILHAIEMGWYEFAQEGEFFSLWTPSIFVLNDPMYLDNFRVAASEILPDLVVVSDLSNTFASVSTSMESLQNLAIQILIFSLFATVLILGLIILLFLYDRRHEIGIYLALGEKRLKVVFQIVSEVVIIAFVGIILSLLVGFVMSEQVTHAMLRHELIQGGSGLQDGWRSHGSSLEAMGFGRQMSHDEMLEIFDISLNAETVVLFFVIGLGTVVVSTVFPVIYIVRMNPKKILMQGKIE